MQINLFRTESPLEFDDCLHFTDEGTEAHKGKVTCLGHTARYWQSDISTLAAELQSPHLRSLGHTISWKSRRSRSPGPASCPQCLLALGQLPAHL